MTDATEPAEVVVVRITPVQPTDTATFRASLAKLSIIVYDISQDSTAVGTKIGQATGLQPLATFRTTEHDVEPASKPDADEDPPSSQIPLLIFQHWDVPVDAEHPFGNVVVAESVGTALIRIEPRLKQSSLNLRLEYQFGGDVVQNSFEYNAAVVSLPDGLPSVPATNTFVLQRSYQSLPPAAYFSTPLEKPAASTVTLPSDGSFPDFTKLVAAIDMALSKDMSASPSKRIPLEQRTTPLTAAQAAEIASVIAWNRALHPVPQASQSLTSMYTTTEDGSGNALSLGNDATNARLRFEGDLQNYSTTLSGDANKLANFVFAASAAIQCEAMSTGLTVVPPQTYLAGLTFPVETGTKDTSSSSQAPAYPHASVVLQYSAAVATAEPKFTVPAAFFYTLGAKYPTQILAEQRFSAACNSTESQLLAEFQKSIDSGKLQDKAAPLIQPSSGGEAPAVVTINANQAARRLVALGATVGTIVDLNIIVGGNASGAGLSNGGNPGGTKAPIDDLLSEWLAYSDTTAVIDDKFWGPAITKFPDSYLDLLLQAVTQANTPLAEAIKTKMNVANVHDLAIKTASQWQDFFTVNPTLLPRFTLPGDTKQCTTVFVQRLQKFFTVTDMVVPDPSAGGGQASESGIPAGDVIHDFLKQYLSSPGTTFNFASLPSDADLDRTILLLFPNDEGWQRWTKTAIKTIGFLVTITSINPTGPNTTPIITPPFQFSLMECLYARGFTRIEQVQNLTGDQFQAALAGTAAYQYAPNIYRIAVPQPVVPKPGPAANFTSVNPDGSLVDFIPPPNLSPVGTTAYLHDLLGLSLSGKSMGQLLATRRGPMGTLRPTSSNLRSRLPAVDLVNESLERLCSNLASPPNVIHNTSDAGALAKDLGVTSVDASALLAAVPEFSSPAKAANPGAYSELAKCFTAADLPYNQGLDICSSNLEVLGVSRFDVMRHFRRDITELPMDAALEPDDFQRHLWRFPAREGVAVAYLNISPEEQKILFRGGQTDLDFLQSVFGLGVEVLQPDYFSVKYFLEFTGLTYSDFFKLHRCHYVPFEVIQAAKRPAGQRDDGTGTTALPQDVEALAGSDLRSLHLRFPGVTATDLPFTIRKLLVFVRLWRSLCRSKLSRIECRGLAKICNTLDLFKDGAVNLGFLRQLAAVLMLRNHFNLPIEEPEPGPLRAMTNHYPPRPRHAGSCLAMWNSKGPGSAEWDLAAELFLDKIEEYAAARYNHRRREVGFRKDLKHNLDQLSLLAGFSGADKWYSKPTGTIRFAEVLAKVFASDFTVGELILLFTAEPHVPGDDPFPMPDALESAMSPLNFPDDDHEHNLWALREKLNCNTIKESEESEWDWCRIESALVGMGYKSSPQDDRLTALGEHFFPHALEAAGRPVDHQSRRFETELAPSDTTASLWGADQHGPFHYDTDDPGCLWTELPLCEEAVLDKLKSTRQLNEKEIGAVQDLYFAPRSVLAPFAFIFENFPSAANKLIHEPSGKVRFKFFQGQFARFHHRCCIIADHLAQHVAAATGNKGFDHRKVAWHVLRCLSADENRPQSQQWETDAGAAPSSYVWDRYLSGSSFSALLGLTGTGLVGEYEMHHGRGNKTVWRETSGDLTFFGHEQDKLNIPIPTILPPLDLEPEARQKPAIEVVNGFALRDSDECCLGGAVAFRVRWSGSLLVDAAGEYTFHAGAPRPGAEEPHLNGTEHQRWLLILRRGRKSWTIINHSWEGSDAPPSCSEPFVLQRGVWNIEICFEQRQPLTMIQHLIHTGFQVKYNGPDTGGILSVVPAGRLFQDSKQDTLAKGLDIGSSAAAYLQDHYYSTLRDIRRTYQRAFKSILLVTRTNLSPEPSHHDQQGESELDFFLRHPSSFLGTSYYRPSDAATFHSHHAYFDFNLLPVSDPYANSPPSSDARGSPSAKRQAALFDIWERLHDYAQLRAWVRSMRSRHASMSFYEAAEQAPKADKLLRYLGIPADLATAALTYYVPGTDGHAGTSFVVNTPDLTDERWTARVWRAGIWLDELGRRFSSPGLAAALPWLWAGDDPNAEIGQTSGNENLTKVVLRGYFEQATVALESVERLNNGLRLRARRGLLAYLCGQNRVALPFGTGRAAKVPRDLSDLLLQDVLVEIHEKTTRIEDAISTVQSFVQRIRLRLEPEVTLTADFVEAWDAKYASFKKWETAKRREIYPENWIQWDELRGARKSESFRNLEKALRGDVLTVPKPSSSFVFGEVTVPKSTALVDLQSLTSVSLTTSGSSMLGYPNHSGQPSLIAPCTSNTSGATATATEKQQLPLWMQAAAEMGSSFIRVSAAVAPVAVAPTCAAAQRCNGCQEIHPPQMDEFYFWLTPAKYFSGRNTDMLNNLDIGATAPDAACSWDPTNGKLGKLLQWNSRPVYYLSWCRVRCGGQFDTNRQSDAGVAVSSTGTGVPALDFAGRKANSLLFNVNGAETFIYDMLNDYTTALTDAIADDVEATPSPATAPTDSIDTSMFPAPLTALPLFVYFEPGAPLVPISNFCTALSVASTLRSHGNYEEALGWYELAFDSPGNPLSANNSWEHPSSGTAPQAVTRTRAVLLEYLEALQQWGEALSTRTDSESCRESLVIFNLLDQILGGHPDVVALQDVASGTTTVDSFTPSAVPINPRLMALYSGVAENLAHLRQGDGPILSSYYEPATQTGGYVSDLHSPHRRHLYRFSYLLPKAVELVESTKSLGSALLSALERGDSAYLATVQTNHERQLLSLRLPGTKEQVRAADWDVQALEQSLKKSLNDLNYYQGLISNGNNTNEQNFIISTELGLALRNASQGTMAAGQGVCEVPDLFAGVAGAMGTPLEFNRFAGGSAMGQALSFASQVLTSQADNANITANMQLTQSNWDRRLDDWMHTANLETVELKALEAQKLAADRRRDTALYELNSTQRQIEHAAEVAAFTRDKASAFDTWLFLQRETALLYRRTYAIALAAAREAQDMLRYELRDPVHAATDFIAQCTGSGAHGSSLRHDLLAGEKLGHALSTMDRAFTKSNVREHELTKQLSLAMHFPAAYLALKLTGRAEFAVPEWMFDLDYPGMYMRRIRSVGLTIPCVVGPYTGIHARLELQGSTIRVSPAVEGGGRSYECAAPASDERFVHLYGARESIATSTGVGDTGLFELSFRDDRYLPFEYAGAVSRWRVELPPENNAFDLASLTDVVVTLNYTAREGGEVLRRSASEAAGKRLPCDGFRLFDMRREFGDAWALLRQAIRQRPADGRKKGKVSSPLLLLRLQLHRHMFPFLTGRRMLAVVRLQVFIHLDEQMTSGSRHFQMSYYPHGMPREEQDVGEYYYESTAARFQCIASSEWPGLYYGAVDVEIVVPTAGKREGTGCGVLAFPEGMAEIKEMSLLCQYVVRDAGMGRRHESMNGAKRGAA